jgi:hypothetical protein
MLSSNSKAASGMAASGFAFVPHIVPRIPDAARWVVEPDDSQQSGPTREAYR